MTLRDSRTGPASVRRSAFRRTWPLALLVACIVARAATAQEGTSAPPPPAPTAGEGVESGILEFSIRDADGRPMPGRLSFLGADGPRAKLFGNPAADPDDLAVRDDVIYSLSGAGRVTVPVGSYEIFASHGLEWSIDRTEVEIRAGGTVRFDAVLRHEVDTTGWISADFHLHTLTYSGHGDANLLERVISIVGEGVEVAVATDHNHHTDYRPTISSLGAEGRVLPVVGNEVSTPLGHFNAFPLDPSAPIFPPRVNDGPTLFRLIRQHDSGIGVRPVIQVNHPRWGGIDYFGEVDLDPIAATSESPRWSNGFDSIEVFNENAGWGYYEAGIDPVETASGRHSVLNDWYHLLDRGLQAAAVGNSDSHTVRAQLAGFPRNFLRVPSDDIGELEIAWVCDALRANRCFTTLGPFVEFTVDGAPVGSRISTGDGSVDLSVRVQAASWIDCDRVIVVVGGDRVLTIEVPESRDPLRLETTVPIEVDRDTWLVLQVEGDTPLAPIVPDTKRPILPLAVTNPVWIDGDGDGAWTAPVRGARRAVAATAGDPVALAALWERASPAERRRLLVATEPGLPGAAELVRLGLAAETRPARIAACGLADRLDDAGFDAALLAIIDDPSADAYLRLRALTALADGGTRRAQVLAWLDREGPAALAESAILADELPGDFVRRWRVAGYFDVPADGAPPPPIESAGDLDRRFLGKGGEIGWEVRETRRNGYLDLLGLDDDPVLAERALAYAEVWLRTEEPRSVPFTLGTDDGCVLFFEDAPVVIDTGTHGADPLQHYGRLPLRAGWNRLILRVENGRGGFGAYFRILDDRVTVATRPEGDGAR